MSEALKYYKESLFLNRSLGLKRSEAQLLGYVGDVYSELKDFSAALEFQEKALLIAKAHGFQDVIKSAKEKIEKLKG